MHLYNDIFFGEHGIVGAQVRLGTRSAFALKYKKLLKTSGESGMGTKLKLKDQNEGCVSDNGDGVSFVYFGDGATNQGKVFELYNMAMLWHLPIVVWLKTIYMGC
jgi:pyruvate dehydrogenase E1 component alpha subunit